MEIKLQLGTNNRMFRTFWPDRLRVQVAVIFPTVANCQRISSNLQQEGVMGGGGDNRAGCYVSKMVILCKDRQKRDSSNVLKHLKFWECYVFFPTEPHVP